MDKFQFINRQLKELKEAFMEALIEPDIDRLAFHVDYVDDKLDNLSAYITEYYARKYKESLDNERRIEKT